MRFEALVEALFLRVTHNVVDGFAVSEEDERGDTEDTEASRRLHVLIDVQFCKRDLPRILRCEAFEDRGHHTAGHAPFSPEINYDQVVLV